MLGIKAGIFFSIFDSLSIGFFLLQLSIEFISAHFFGV
jgi:hypothetical protein